MAERLTVSLENGRLEQLRRMAGGERKVGAYLSNVVRFLATYEELVTTEDFQNLCIVQRVAVDELPQQALQEIYDNFETWRKEAEERHAVEAQAMRSSYAELMVRLVQLEQRSLPTQEESGSRNDA